MSTDTLKINELRHRVDAKRRRIEAELERAKADAAGTTSETLHSLRSALDRLNDLVREGWDNLTETAVSKLNDWLDEESGEPRQ